jgi:hypothetical protein
MKQQSGDISAASQMTASPFADLANVAGLGASVGGAVAKAVGGG